MTYHRHEKSRRFLHAALGFPIEATLLGRSSQRRKLHRCRTVGKHARLKDLTELTNGFTNGGRQQESFAPTGTYTRQRRLKNSSKQFPTCIEEISLKKECRHLKGISRQYCRSIRRLPNQRMGRVNPTNRVLTLNLLRQSNVAPNISAYAYHHGTFDITKMLPRPNGLRSTISH
eukprot:CCRYP_008348-RA/>CCRYP_008348-RA protein AED:0.46 eAED:0.46 QI:0/0/0/1/0/0/3/0/173